MRVSWNWDSRENLISFKILMGISWVFGFSWESHELFRFSWEFHECLDSHENLVSFWILMRISWVLGSRENLMSFFWFSWEFQEFLDSHENQVRVWILMSFWIFIGISCVFGFSWESHEIWTLARISWALRFSWESRELLESHENLVSFWSLVRISWDFVFLWESRELLDSREILVSFWSLVRISWAFGFSWESYTLSIMLAFGENFTGFLHSDEDHLILWFLYRETHEALHPHHNLKNFLQTVVYQWFSMRESLNWAMFLSRPFSEVQVSIFRFNDFMN